MRLRLTCSSKASRSERWNRPRMTRIGRMIADRTGTRNPRKSAASAKSAVYSSIILRRCRTVAATGRMEDFMRLVTYQDGAGVHVGALRGDAVVALDSVAPDMLALIDQGAAGLAAAQAVLASAESSQPLANVTLLAPIPRPRQNVVCVGLNYVAHAIESDRARGREPKLPTRPVFFTKAVTAVAGPHSDFLLDPAVTEQLDYEAEAGLRHRAERQEHCPQRGAGLRLRLHRGQRHLGARSAERPPAVLQGQEPGRELSPRPVHRHCRRDPGPQVR
jgi:hypothetical protein